MRGERIMKLSPTSFRFITPVRLGDILEMRAGISYVGNTSLETTINVIRVDPENMSKEHVTTAYFNYVRIDNSGKPVKLKPHTPQNDKEKRIFEEALLRRKKLLSHY